MASLLLRATITDSKPLNCALDRDVWTVNRADFWIEGRKGDFICAKLLFVCLFSMEGRHLRHWLVCVRLTNGSTRFFLRNGSTRLTMSISQYVCSPCVNSLRLLVILRDRARSNSEPLVAFLTLLNRLHRVSCFLIFFDPLKFAVKRGKRLEDSILASSMLFSFRSSHRWSNTGGKRDQPKTSMMSSDWWSEVVKAVAIRAGERRQTNVSLPLALHI